VNPLLRPSSLPYGFPDFTAIREEHFEEAFAAGMAERRAEVDAITAQAGPPTFADTVVALERSGATLRRVSAIFFMLVGSLSTPGIREIEARVAPRLAAHADAITLDPALFARLEALHAARHDLGLDPESLRLLERRHRDAVRAGARLGAAEQERLRALNAELATLTAEFGTRDSKGRLPFHSWFVGFVPGDPKHGSFNRTDSKLVVLAFAYDSRTKGNVATEIVKYYLQMHFGIKKDYRLPNLLKRGNFYQSN